MEFLELIAFTDTSTESEVKTVANSTESTDDGDSNDLWKKVQDFAGYYLFSVLSIIIYTFLNLMIITGELVLLLNLRSCPPKTIVLIFSPRDS